jgi:hypothetical protein
MATGASAATRVHVTVDSKSVAVERFAGGHARADVVTVASGTDPRPRKHISTVRFEEMSMELGVAHAQPWLDWANSFMSNTHLRKTGTVAFANASNDVRAYLDVHGALLTEVGFPALDGASKDAARMTLRIRPESTTRRDGDDAKLPSLPSPKAALRSNFRVRVGDLPATRITKVDALTWRMKVQEVLSGGERFAQIIPTLVEMPTLRLTIAAADVKPWLTWFDDFVIQGHSSDAKELSGGIDYLAPNKNVLVTLELRQIGIFELEMPSEGRTDAAATFTASMYFESGQLKFV